MNNNKLPAEGFTAIADRPDGFDALAGPRYLGYVEGNPVLAFRVEPHHLNPVGGCHGGVLAALADIQAVAAKILAGLHGRASPTITLSVDYIAPVKLGAWVELHTTLLRQTHTLLFTEGHIYADRTLVARCSGIYKIGPPNSLPSS
jgi:uncharacterized protein (TIGR00369 family)